MARISTTEDQQAYADSLRTLTDAELRREYVEAGNVYEHFGGYWTMQLVQEEMKRREERAVGVQDYRVHFRYHDAVNGLIGRHRYRYEAVHRSEVVDIIKYLDGRGFDEFSIRRLGTLDPWMPVEARIALS